MVENANVSVAAEAWKGWSTPRQCQREDSDDDGAVDAASVL